MGKSWTLLVLVLGACQPLYGGSPQKLRNPAPVKPPTLPGGEDKIVYVERCDLFTTKVARVTRQTTDAEVYTLAGDKKLADYARAPTKPDLIVDGIDRYIAALRKDPFSAQATLKLALAYHEVRRKGCALALLERLDQLAQHPKFARDANDAIDQITQRGNRTWFEGYRREALRAVGRTDP